jgi:hypothetical protein
MTHEVVIRRILRHLKRTAVPPPILAKKRSTGSHKTNLSGGQHAPLSRRRVWLRGRGA